jgi:hypothetical protein
MVFAIVNVTRPFRILNLIEINLSKFEIDPERTSIDGIPFQPRLSQTLTPYFLR